MSQQSQGPGQLALVSDICPLTLAVACGWSPWTPWSPCSQSCNVGIRRRFRAGTAPPAAFGGAECQGPNLDAEFCSLRPCRGESGDLGPETSLKNLSRLPSREKPRIPPQDPMSYIREFPKGSKRWVPRGLASPFHKKDSLGASLLPL